MDSILGPWSQFNLAMAGVAAALAGFVIVASSVNIGAIIKSSALTARLAAGIASLVLALLASSLGLVPQITSAWFGVVLLCGTAGSAVFQVHATVLIFSTSDPHARALVPKAALGFFPIAAYLLSAIMVMLGLPAGLYFAAAGCVLAIVAAIIVSWVALVEVLR